MFAKKRYIQNKKNLFAKRKQTAKFSCYKQRGKVSSNSSMQQHRAFKDPRLTWPLPVHGDADPAVVALVNVRAELGLHLDLVVVVLLILLQKKRN